MNRFFLIFSSSFTKEDKAKLDSILSKIDTSLSADDLLLSKIAMAKTNDYELVKKMINSMKNNSAIGNIIVIDDEQHTCFIHKAGESESHIRQHVLPDLLKAYEVADGNGHWFGKVVDARHFSTTKMTN